MEETKDLRAERVSNVAATITDYLLFIVTLGRYLAAVRKLALEGSVSFNKTSSCARR